MSSPSHAGPAMRAASDGQDAEEDVGEEEEEALSSMAVGDAVCCRFGSCAARTHTSNARRNLSDIHKHARVPLGSAGHEN